ncbi:MAG TPA: hypothetical protein RMF84_08425 [Polyangiaceae bacterium LLY-WYZ-14_1]|nr:hypothetical protein [Polyangiaceae bacterium LLY-WYZ-14_1]
MVDRRYRRALGIAALAGALGGACGSDDANGGKTPWSGTEADGGLGLEDGPFGISGDGSDCPLDDCRGFDLVDLFDLAPCCLPGTPPACGLVLRNVVRILGLDVDRSQCVALHQPGERDASCGVRFEIGIRLEGCCRPDGTCGYLPLADRERPSVPPFGCVPQTLFADEPPRFCSPDPR